MQTARPVSFQSGKWKLRGYFHEPAGTPPFACIVMCHGFSGTMDRLAETAKMFCEAGFAVLVFDYRNFGESEGKPRQVISLERQLDDIKSAIAFARGVPSVDPKRIALWGSSLGGGHAVVAAARDGKIAAVVAQVPFNGFPKKVEGRSRRETRKLIGAMLKDWLRAKLGLPRYYVPAVGRPGEIAVMASDDAALAVEAMQGQGGTSWKNSVAPAVLLEMSRYKPSDHAKTLAAPLLVSAAEYDREIPVALLKDLVNAAPRGEIRRYPIRHFDVYRPEVREAVVKDQISFLKSHLEPSGS